MKSIEVIPLKGIRLDGKQVNLYSSKEEVLSVLGSSEQTEDEAMYYFDNELRIELDDKNMVQYIEFLGGFDGELQPQMDGINLLQDKADKVESFLREKNNGKVDDSEGEYGYSFLDISVGVYRSTTPEDVNEMVEEAKREGEQLDSEDLEMELKNAMHWNTIGIGVKDYFTEV